MMDRKEIATLTAPIVVETDNEGYVYLDKGDNNITFTPQQATALHSALDEMLNPWRPISDFDKIGWTFEPVYVSSGDDVKVAYFDSNSGIWEPNVSFPPTHWKPITLPETPKI